MASGTVILSQWTKLPGFHGTSEVIRIKKVYDNFTFNANGYIQIDTLSTIISKFPSYPLQNSILVGMVIQGFSNGNIYSIARGSDGSLIYAIGAPSKTISNFGVQYFFLNTWITALNWS